jgi:hypothetical protein
MNKTEIRKLKKESLVIMVFENQGFKETIKNLQDGNKELVIQNSQLNNELKLNKDMSVHLSEYRSIETKNKQLENLLKEYKAQINATKINYLESLETKIHKLENENKLLRDEREQPKDKYKPKHLLKLFEDTKNENENLKEEIETLKVKYNEITIKQEKQTQLITDLYDGL